MKELLRQSIDGALERLRAAGSVPADVAVNYQIEMPKNPEHGDFSANAAMVLAKSCRRPPREVAADLCRELAADPLFSAVDIAGPGFINFVLDNASLFAVIEEVIGHGAGYGRSQHGQGEKVQVEFVSANPTGPLHIGHGRGAAIGSVIAALLDNCGFAVSREYYVNDAGRQMDILALSVFLRYLECCGETVTFPNEAYQGDYIRTIGASLYAEHGAGLRTDFDALTALATDDPERRLDGGIAALKAALGVARYEDVRARACAVILDEIKQDLSAFGVRFDTFYSEASLAEAGLIDKAIAELEKGGHLYLHEGARWFRSTALGDEKDRVIVRDNGLKTYFASDIAYHLDKFARGFSHVVDVWGADHHGYVPRVRAAISASGHDPARLEVVLVQFAALVRGGEKVAMSTRSGEFVTLKELVEEVGVDAARFFYVMRRADQHLEFDLDLATAQSNDNPVFYVQYAHARICSVFRQLEERGLDAGHADGLAATLGSDVERRIVLLMSRFPEMLLNAALAREPHLLPQYLRDLANEFHGYYNSHKFLLDDAATRGARLRLISAVRQVLANGLAILGIAAPEEM